MSTDFAQDDYIKFMLGAAATTSTPVKSPSSQSQAASTSSSSKKKSPKKNHHGGISRAFAARYGDWKHNNDQLVKVLQSIVNLRSRLAFETKLSKSSRIISLENNRRNEWEGFGFRSKKFHLQLQDIEMAKDHDLLQHEKMLSAARSLTASMAQDLDAMGRRLDEWMMVAMSISEEDASMPVNELNNFRLQGCQQLYAHLAQELYRKQTLLDTLFSSCNAGLLSGEAIKGTTSQEVALKCLQSWNVGSPMELELVEIINLDQM